MAGAAATSSGSSNATMVWAAAAALLVALILAMAAPPVAAQVPCSSAQISSLTSQCTNGGIIPATPKAGCCTVIVSVGQACVCYLFKLGNVPSATAKTYYATCRVSYVC